MKTIRVPCPVHGGRDANCALWRDKRGRLHAKCWSYNCDPRAILAALGEIPGDIPTTSHDREQSAPAARRIWDSSRSAGGTLVEGYLRSRGIQIEPPASLRFHPALKHPSGVLLPAMVACVEDRDCRLLGIHRTWLTSSGTKAALDPVKAALGPVSGGAVRLAPTLGERVVLAEGIETALSILQATAIATLATLSTSGLRSIQLPSGVKEVVIAADADEPGELAAQESARRLMAEGRKVRIARTGRPGKDFNDLRL